METCNILIWILLWVASSLFWVWICLLGGAERVEGTFSSIFVFGLLGPLYSAEWTKVGAWLSLFFGTIWFVVGLFLPGARIHLW